MTLLIAVSAWLTLLLAVVVLCASARRGDAHARAGDLVPAPATDTVLGGHAPGEGLRQGPRALCADGRAAAAA